MTRKLIYCRNLIFFGYFVNLCVCQQLLVQKQPQANWNYSNILVTKHNYFNYLRRTTAKPISVQNDQSASWELVAINQNSDKIPDKNAEDTAHPTRNFTNDFYSFNCTMTGRPTTKLTPIHNRYPMSSTQKIPKRPPSSTRSPLLLTRSSKKKKVIYVDPPIISAVETVLDSAYDMVEDAFTTKKKIRLTTVSPNVKKRTKKSPNGNKLITTQVHVTSEYEPITQATVLNANNRVQSSESSSSEEYYEEDLLYYDEDDDEESDEEYSVESPPVRSKPAKIKPVIVEPVQVNIFAVKEKKCGISWKKCV